ncbi:hypothetical protein LCGC14_2404840 [marine sediment metagenome]|uniref:Uncharacterized protein n=1 Tax=marine sediment metagenome TaxID=412755 RepID=A0A0F9BUA2_9ZZZZ
MIYVLITAWLLMGAIGHMLMRQGFLVDFESSLGRKRAWDTKDNIVSIIGISSGPIAILMAFLVTGKRCLRKRPK